MMFKSINGNIPRVSDGFLSAESISMELDSRLFPHIVWMEKGNGNYHLYYRQWDGLQWTHIESPKISESSDRIILGQNNMVLENDLPTIVFGRRKESQNSINIYKDNYGQWEKISFDVSYDIEWIGVSSSSKRYEFSSSSSQSIVSSLSSISWIESISSSSSLEYSSSSSSKPILSSLSYEDDDFFVIVVDSNLIVRIYLLEDKVLNHVGSIQILERYKDLKIHNCGDHIGFSFSSNRSVHYGFFDTKNYSFVSNWGEVSFTSKWVSFDCCGSNSENDGILYFTFVKQTEESSYIHSKIVTSNGIDNFFGYNDGVINEIENDTIISNNFLINNARFISTYFSEGNLFILSFGGKSKLFIHNKMETQEYIVDIRGFDENKPKQGVLFAFGEEYFFSVINNNSVYYLYSNLDEVNYTHELPNLYVLNDKRFKYFKNGTFKELFCVWDNKSGDLLRESKLKTIVTVNNTEDPLCEESSSESQVNSDSSSSTSGLSTSFDIIRPCDPECEAFIRFQTYTVPDRLIARNANGQVVLDTGFISTGQKWAEYEVTNICGGKICIDAPYGGTSWNVQIEGCGFHVLSSGGIGYWCWGEDDEDEIPQISSTSEGISDGPIPSSFYVPKERDIKENWFGETIQKQIQMQDNYIEGEL